MKIRSEERLSDSEFRQLWTSVAAYYLAEKRHFDPGKELDDWLLAEHDYFNMLISRYLKQAHEDGGLSVKGLQRLAKFTGVENAEELTQTVDLIHAIQKACKEETCFNFEPGNHCSTKECCQWKAECKQLVAKWQKP